MILSVLSHYQDVLDLLECTTGKCTKQIMCYKIYDVFVSTEKKLSYTYILNGKGHVLHMF